MAHDLKVSKATGPALDWMVALCEEQATPKGMTSAEVLLYRSVASNAWMYPRTRGIAYCTNWAHGGPIIEREHISTTCDHSGIWVAYSLWNYADVRQFMQGGSTPLIAAMRCYVASKLGEEVEVPDELA